MMHELLLTLLGFPSPFIEECEGPPELGESRTYRVKPGSTELADSEKDQINKLVPLGLYFIEFEDFIRQHQLGWARSDSNTELYKAALSMAVQELLDEYSQDIADFEQLLFQEKTIPLSHLLQHLQKVDYIA